MAAAKKQPLRIEAKAAGGPSRTKRNSHSAAAIEEFLQHFYYLFSSSHLTQVSSSLKHHDYLIALAVGFKLFESTLCLIPRQFTQRMSHFVIKSRLGCLVIRLALTFFHPPVWTPTAYF
ncbi:hypothetical protein IAS59_000289 [Cryptococcus gattii]